MSRFAARANAPEPKYAREPIRPDFGRMIHRDDPLSAERFPCVAAEFLDPEPSFRLRRNIDAKRQSWMMLGFMRVGVRPLDQERLSAICVEWFAFDSAPMSPSCREVVASGGMSGQLRNIFLRKRGYGWFFRSLTRILPMTAPVEVCLLRVRSSGATPVRRRREGKPGCILSVR